VELRARLLRDNRLAGVSTHLEILDREVILVKAQKAEWQARVGTTLVGTLAEERAVLARRAGEGVQAEAMEAAAELARAVEQAERIAAPGARTEGCGG
jgi:hypothetical protein